MSAGDSDWLYQVLKETDLTAFYNAIRNELQVTKLEHWKFVTNDDLKRIHLAPPSIKRLQDAVAKKKSQIKRQRIISKIAGRSASSPRNTPNVENDRVEEETNAITRLIPAEQLKRFETLGEGSFGLVKRGLWTRSDGKRIHVAVKELHESINLVDELAQEVNVMFHLKHPNLVRLYGIVFSKPIMMVLELCEGGSLLDRLRCTEKQKLLVSDLWSLAKQIVSGMAYLEQKRCIHRDLAARNVLLSSDEKAAKIGDFGLMRVLSNRDEHYVMSGQKKVPFPWCAPESLKFKKFSNYSDVWMFGVTLWEMFSYGAEPWCGYNGPEILKSILDGQRLSQSKECPMAVYDLMLRCWSAEAQDRPNFAVLSDSMHKYDFLTAVTKESQKGTDDLLDLMVDDQVVVINGRVENYFWFGQSVRTREFGDFAHKLVVVNQGGNGGAVGTVRDISRPIPGSFVHAGHGDGRGGDSWGFPDRIDPLYLQNPMPLINGQPSSPKRPTSSELKPPPSNSAGRSESSSGSLMSFDDNFDDDGDFTTDLTASSPVNNLPEESAVVANSSNRQRSNYYSVPPTSSQDIYAPIRKAQANLPQPDSEQNVTGRLYTLPPTEVEIPKKISPPVPLIKPQRPSVSPVTEIQPPVNPPPTFLQAPPKNEKATAVNGTPDPFEVSPDVLRLANNRRYADHFEIGNTSTPTTSTISTTFDSSGSIGSSVTPNSSTSSFTLGPQPFNVAPPTTRLPPAVVQQLIYDVNNKYNQRSHPVAATVVEPISVVTTDTISIISPPANKSPRRRNVREDPLLSGLSTNISTSSVPASSSSQSHTVVRIPMPMAKEAKENLSNELASRMQEKRHSQVVNDVKLRSPVSPAHSNVAAYDNYLTRETLAWVAQQQQQPDRIQSSLNRHDAHRGSLPSSSNISIRPVTAFIPPPNMALSPAHFQSSVPPAFHQNYTMSRVASMPSTSLWPTTQPSMLQPLRLQTTTAAVTPAVLDLFDPLVGKVPDELVKAVQVKVPNQPVGVCQRALKAVELDVQKAIEKLKIDELSNSFSFDRERARDALVKFNWDMNMAADYLLS